MIKYRIPYKSYDNSDWLIEFDIIGYTGTPINARGVADRVGVLSYDGGVDDLWDNPLVNVSLSSAIYNQGQVDQMEFLTLNDRDCKITVTRNGQVKFQGYLIPDNQQIRLASIPYEMEFGATSGLPLLETLQFSVFGAELGTRCPLN
ncbi:hypothetical protein [Sphingobacterium humi]|uniref:Uncharacterized protein n=1 Tax=Sphingobacterium humi TaxID=1796905 RepID=A0A6N8L1W1_9SPHI|nr:hypothetical protein [Sphingobacterium humi]MVZ62148.1 hypothetical protein [Sphingobacterium humi]